MIGLITQSYTCAVWKQMDCSWSRDHLFGGLGLVLDSEAFLISLVSVWDWTDSEVDKDRSKKERACCKEMFDDWLVMISVFLLFFFDV